MRHGDLPAHKNTIMSGLCGRGEEFVKLRGLTKNYKCQRISWF